MKIFQKKRASGGFTLTETLVTVAVVSILFAAIVVGIGSAFNVQHDAVIIAEAQTLASTLSSYIGDEFHYAHNIRQEATSSYVTYDSATFGSGVHIATDEGVIKVFSADGSKKYDLLGQGAYTSNLKADVSVSLEGEGVVKIEITIKDADDIITTLNFKVQPLN